jgi:hypothetical protein
MEMCLIEIQICVCLWKNRGMKIYLKLKSGISKSKQIWSEHDCGIDRFNFGQ